MKKKIILFTSLLVLLLPTYSQVIISGLLTDREETPVKYASIQLFSLSDSTFIDGAISHEDGRFTISTNHTITNSFIHISCMGYENKDVLVYNPNLGIIILNTADNWLGEVTIKGERPVHELKGGKLITTIENTILSDIGNAKDILKYLPGVWEQEDGSITILGKGNPVIYINNRLLHNEAELQQLSSQDIEKIEVINNPGAAYSSEVTAVIRIKTKKNKVNGWSGNIITFLSWKKNWYNYDDISLNFHSNKLDVFGSFSYSKGTAEISNSVSLLSVFTEPEWSVFSDSKLHKKDHSFDGKIGFNYSINKNHTIGAQYKNSYGKPTNTLSSLDIYFEENNINDSVWIEQKDTRKSNQHYINTFYLGQISDKLDIDFNFDAIVNTADRNEYSEEESLLKSSRIIDTYSKSDNSLYIGKLVLSYGIGKNKFEIGGEYTNINNKNDYGGVTELVEESHTKTKEHKGAAFLSYMLEINKIYIQAGLRYEQTIKNYYEEEIKKVEQSKTYKNLFPDFSLSFPLTNETKISLAYSQKMRRPTFKQLDGSVIYFGPSFLSSGNPLLQPTINHDVTWQTLYKKYRLGVSYQYIKNYIAPIRRIYDESQQIMIQSPENLKNNQILNISFNASPTIACWTPMFHINYAQPFLKVPFEEKNRYFNNPLFSFSLNNHISLPKEILLSATIYATTAGSNSTTERKSNWGTGFTARKQFLNKKLHTTLHINDPFNTRCFSYTRYNETNTLSDKNTWSSRAINITFTYYFNKKVSSYKGENISGEEINRLN